MRGSWKPILAAAGALAIAGCSGAAEEEPAAETAQEAPAMAETAGSDPAGDTVAGESAEVFEVCDADGNRYPSEADAEAAGLDRAEYGATFCEYAD